MWMFVNTFQWNSAASAAKLPKQWFPLLLAPPPRLPGLGEWLFRWMVIPFVVAFLPSNIVQLHMKGLPDMLLVRISQRVHSFQSRARWINMRPDIRQNGTKVYFSKGP